MNHPIVRVGIAVGALLAMGAVGVIFLSSTSTSASFSPFLGNGEGGDTLVCFLGEQGLTCVERAVEVEAAGLDSERLLTSLLVGPTAGERARGLWSAIPAGSALEEVEAQPDGTVIVRLRVPLDSLRSLDHDTFEAIVQQIGWTLDLAPPVYGDTAWRDLRIQVWDPIVEQFVSLADFLPPIPDPRKETLLGGEESEGVQPLCATHVGQPPAPGQGQPQGGLSGKTVYVSAGHGWKWNDYTNNWRTQRPPYPNPPYEGPIIEDHNNAEAVNQYLLQYLWNAGALTWPVRERNMHAAEVVVDNDDPGPGTGYAETGTWTTAVVTGTGYAGTDYRYATTVTGTPAATAVWTATLPTDSRYAVYVWYRPGSNRAPDACYTIHHAGGETPVTVDQRHHGVTWRYVGTYGFRGGEEARVALTNRSAVTSSVVVADAVRFGGGTFDDLSGIETDATGPPDKPWWEVAAYYYTQRMGMGAAPGDVTSRPIYARWEHAGTGDDAVYVSWHTNGVSGYQTHTHGTLSILHNGEGNPITPGSELLRDTIHAELIHDIRAGWDAGWPEYKRRMNLGELRELWDDNPDYAIPGVLIEVAYHDHPDDTDALKEPHFNMLAARAFYQGIVKYFEQRDGIDLTELPEPPTHLAIQNVGGGQVRVSWRPSPTDTVGLVGDPATGYRIYTSTDGLGWSNGVPVTATTTYTLTGLAPEQLFFIRVTATNDGGESFPTEALAVRVGDDSEVILVNGFDRLNRTMLVPETDPVEGGNLRMFLDRMNRYDYAIQHGEVISYSFDGASNEAVREGVVSLGDYTLVDWILGEESAPDETLDATERALLVDLLQGGGALFLSGTEVGWHLDDQGADAVFYNTILRADYAGDDAETYQVTPAPGSIFEGLNPFRFDAAGMYDADYPDQMSPVNGSVAALSYNGGLGGTAAVQYENGCERLVYFGFPFETIWPDQRPAVMARVFDFLDLCLAPPVNTKIVAPLDGSAHNEKPAFEGTAEVDEMATLDRVEVQIQRASDDRYWAGSDWMTGTAWITGTAWMTETTWVTATGTLTWFYTLPALSDSSYHLRGRAWTTDGVVDSSPAGLTFIYDTHAPTSTVLITPTSGITISALPGATLVWEPAVPDGGSPLAYVVQLDGQYYTTTQPAYTVTPIADGPHVWGVRVFDTAGNLSEWITSTFYVSRHHLWLPLVTRDFKSAGGVCTDVLLNGGFESDEGWVLNQLATYDTTNVHSGEQSMRVGISPGEPGDDTYSSVAQVVALPSGSQAVLQLWVYPIGEESDSDDWHYVSLRDESDTYYALDHWHSDARAWERREYDLSAYLGQVVTLYVGTRNDGDDDTAALYVDDVVLEICP
ncbi:MAG: fibronectin type III domain-containing protein [Chloroflexota bacterium]|nr:fibronectin type III domain-containing protein [Chloroflexota bacterium]